MRPTVDGLLASIPSGLAAGLRAALAAANAGVEVWAVGGAVRDLALGRTVVDVDIATSADPGPRPVAAAPAIGGTVEAHEAFGTASVGGAGGRIDFARLRTEAYAHSGALPSPSFGATIEQDLARRDFSVNALALCLRSGRAPRTGELVDPCGGLADLEARRLRALHAGSFRDDATRIWRGARYAARLRLRPDAETRTRLIEGTRWLDTISGERLWAEFERSAAEPVPGRVLALLEAWGALEGSAPGWRLHPDAARALSRRRGPMDPALLFAVATARVDSEARGAICERLAAPREAQRAARETAALLEVTTITPDALAGVEGASDVARRASRWLDPPRQQEVQRALRRWERTRPSLSAADLQALGVPRGPALGDWLRRLRAARYLGTLRTAAEARRAVRDGLDTSTSEATKG